MEEDRATAKQCMFKADQFREAGELEKALRFYEKANRIYATIEAEKKIKMVQEEIAGGGRRASAAASEGAPKKKTAEQPHAPPKNDNNVNPVQMAAVKRIKAAKDYYDCLEVTKTATDDEIKKKYRKLALLVHPDKCQAPGAEEAFKSVTRAFQCLSDPQKRSDYDNHGHEDGAAAAYAENMRSQTRHRTYGHTGNAWQGMSPEEMFFREFFGANVHRYGGPFGSFNVRTTRQRPTAQPQHHHEGSVNLLPLLQLLPIFLVILMTFFTVPGGQDPQFSLQKTREFPISRRTKLGSVEYFIKPGMDFKGRGVEYIEREVILTYRKQMQHACHLERNEKQYLTRQAQMYTGKQGKLLMKKAEEYKTRSCTEYHRVDNLLRVHK